MRILTTIKQALGLVPVYSRFDLGNPQGRARPSDVRSLVEEHNTSWVYVCASRNAETIAGVPLKLYARGGTADYYQRRGLTKSRRAYIERVTRKDADDVDEIEEGHPLIDLLDTVNTELTNAELMELTVTYQELTGDAYWYLEPGPLGLPQAIWPLMSQYVRIVRDREGVLTGYLYGKDQMSRVALAAADVLHFRYPNPKDPDYGLSPLAATFGATTLMEAEQEYMRNTYDRGGMPEVGILIKGRLTEEQRKTYYAEWARKFASKRKGEKAIVLEGDMDIKTFGYPPKDVGIEFEQKFSREEVAAAFGVPLTMIQLNEASRAGAEAGMYQYYASTIAPKLRRIEQKLNEGLCTRYDPRLFVIFEDVVPEDRSMRLKEIEVRLKSQMTTINEERALDGLPSVDWGDEPIVAPSPFGGLGIEPVKSAKAQPAMTVNEKRFSEKVTDHFVRYAREVDERIEGV